MRSPVYHPSGPCSSWLGTYDLTCQQGLSQQSKRRLFWARKWGGRSLGSWEGPKGVFSQPGGRWGIFSSCGEKGRAEPSTFFKGLWSLSLSLSGFQASSRRYILQWEHLPIPKLQIQPQFLFPFISQMFRETPVNVINKKGISPQFHSS